MRQLLFGRMCFFRRTESRAMRRESTLAYPKDPKYLGPPVTLNEGALFLMSSFR